MLHMAICDDDITFLDKSEAIVRAYNKTQAAETHIVVEKYPSSSILLDNVMDGDIYDVYLLDIEMPEIDGLSLAQHINEIQPKAVILFLTSHDELEYAQAGFKVKALRYIHKLNMEETLPEALGAAIQEIQSSDIRYLTLTYYNDSVRIPYDRIMYIQRVKRVSEIVVKGQEPYRDNHGLMELYEKLNDSRFVYIERGCFVNLDYVLRIGDSQVWLASGEKLPVSRKMLPSLRATILRLWGGIS